jgi:hypothetical protein
MTHFLTAASLGGAAPYTPTHTLVTSLHDTHTFRPNLLNQLRLSYFKTQDTISPIDPQKNLFQWGDTSYIQDPAVINQNPDFNVAGAFSAGDGRGSRLSRKTRSIVRAADTVTWIHGAHSFKTGLEIDQFATTRTSASFLTNGELYF